MSHAPTIDTKNAKTFASDQSMFNPGPNSMTKITTGKTIAARNAFSAKFCEISQCTGFIGRSNIGDSLPSRTLLSISHDAHTAVRLRIAQLLKK